MQKLGTALESESHHQAIQVSCAHHYGCSTSNSIDIERLCGISQKVHSEVDYVVILIHSADVQEVGIGVYRANGWG